MPRTRSVNLTAALVAVALLELTVNRVGARLFFPQATLSGGGGSRTGHLVGTIGPFLFQLTAILALGLMIAAFVGLLRRGELYPRQMRFTVVAIALVFAAFCGQALVRGHIPARFFLHLATAFGFLALLTAAAFVRAPVPRRVKIGLAAFALPGVLHAFARVCIGWLQGGRCSAVLAVAAEVALLVAAIGAPFLLTPRPADGGARRWRLPLAVAVTLTVVLLAVLVVRFDLLQASVLYGLRLELPPPVSVAGLAHLVGFFCWIFATTELLATRGGFRLAGYGLVLLALGGYQTGSPVELSLSLLGILALAVGELRAEHRMAPGQPRLDAAAWRAFVGRLANGVVDGNPPDDTRPEAVVVSEGNVEVSRIRTHRRGQPVSIRLLRRRGALVELDATVGQPGHDVPDASIERHRRWLARSPDLRLNLPRQKTGDTDFDQRFSVHGQAPLGDDELRARVARHLGDAVVTLWHGSGARYLLANPTAPSEAPPIFAGQIEGEAPVAAIAAILDTLVDLVETSRPAAGP